MTPRVSRKKDLFATDATGDKSAGIHGSVGSNTYKRQFRNDDRQSGQEVDGKIGQVVVGIVSAEEEEHDGHAEQKLLSRSILIAVVDLLPHVEVIVGTGVEFERDAPHPVEHEEGAEHVADIGQGPRGLLRDDRHDIVEDLEECDQYKVDGPGTCSRDTCQLVFKVLGLILHAVRMGIGSRIIGAPPTHPSR